jgi:hypothetical protein
MAHQYLVQQPASNISVFHRPQLSICKPSRGNFFGIATARDHWELVLISEYVRVNSDLIEAMAKGQWRSSRRHRDTRPLTSVTEAATATADELQQDSALLQT